MRTLRTTAVLAAALPLCGCYRPYHYAPPYPNYQGPAAPVQTLQPGPYYAPGPATPQPPPLGAPSFNGGLQPTPAQPTPANPGTFDNGGGFDPGTGGDFDLGDGSGGSSGGDVPYYEEPGQTFDNFDDPTGGFQDPVRPTPDDDFGFENFDANKPTGPSAMAPPAVAPPALAAAPDARPIAPLGDDPFGGPVVVETAPVRQASAEFAYLPPTRGETTLDPYAHEEGTYAWLRGVVSQDVADGSWSITYDLEPEPYDDHGGNLTLAGDRLGDLADGEVVLVEGRVDPSSADRFGKPVYRVGEVVKLGVSVD